MNISDICIVGAQGQMGHLFAKRSLAAGFGVRGLDRPLSDEAVRQAVLGADLVLLAVPTKAMAEVSARVSQFMESNQILADLCSVKVQPLADMLAAYDGPVVGTHPLFGPHPAEQETRVAVVPGRGEDAALAVTNYCTALGFAPFATTDKEHDQAMAAIQGLNFVTSVSYLATLAHRPELEQFVTPSFNRRLEAARKMLTEDSELFAGFLEANPFMQESVRNFRSMLNIAAGGDIELLCARANWWWRSKDTQGEV